MKKNKKQIIFFLISILFILGGLFTALYWMSHIDQLKKSEENGVSIVVTNTVGEVPRL
ncbi:hypothetical protein [Bacillus sp. FJAT-49736]|uniref:hypothetical protein n=1 Tax=Bacillus sp. FJAT-49736 TaxID=2833582 RepID=UPI001BC8EC66|nr:hypothetical protein [Bacillus sp. FJAT-49736]MBS4175007.1 hypothetical protein [Bacillus sp. FJAT-49736]